MIVMFQLGCADICHSLNLFENAENQNNDTGQASVSTLELTLTCHGLTNFHASSSSSVE